MRAEVDKESTALKATALPRLIKDKAVVKRTLMRMELTGIRYRGETRLIQCENGRPLSRLSPSQSTPGYRMDVTHAKAKACREVDASAEIVTKTSKTKTTITNAIVALGVCTAFSKM